MGVIILMVNRSMKTIVLSIMFALLLMPKWIMLGRYSPISAMRRAGTASMQFLKLGAGARAAAMGNSIAATSVDGYALYWNPAALVWNESPKSRFRTISGLSISPMILSATR